MNNLNLWSASSQMLESGTDVRSPTSVSGSSPTNVPTTNVPASSSGANEARPAENGADQNSVETCANEPAFEDLFGAAENADLCSNGEEEEDCFSTLTGWNVLQSALAVIFIVLMCSMCCCRNKDKKEQEQASRRNHAEIEALKVKQASQKKAEKTVVMEKVENEYDDSEIKRKLEEEAAKREYIELKRRVGAINEDIKKTLCWRIALVSQLSTCCWHFKNLTVFTCVDCSSPHKICVTGQKDGGLWADVMPGNDACTGGMLAGWATFLKITMAVLMFLFFVMLLPECCCKSGFEQNCMGLVLLPETDLTTMEEIESWKTAHASFLAKGANL